MKTLIALLLLFPTSLLCVEPGSYNSPEINLEQARDYQKPKIQKQEWEEPIKLHPEKEIERNIASEPGRRPSSNKKKLFKPWLYRKYKVVP